MIKIYILSFVIASTLCTELIGIRENQLLTQFHEFISKYNKNYKSLDEFNGRFQSFKENVGKLLKYAVTRTSNHKVVITQFFDLSPQEFERIYMKLIKTNLEFLRSETNHVIVENKKNADSFDWRGKGAVGKVKDQGMTGSSVNLVAVGNIEGQNFIKNGKFISL